MAMGRLLSESESMFGLFYMMSRSKIMDTTYWTIFCCYVYQPKVEIW